MQLNLEQILKVFNIIMGLVKAFLGFAGDDLM